ncbi:hypothetical protein [Acinetobacter larvae]|uniref:Uncharacterized protein n=1 Tax=Acinetobacter larvae TaxID=1789224 RepID=A0A1B2M027_9GAMM|nr:hypothetical protein [Acinetobacter larvae]AOA58547.1 hypothetical protein BFG52_09415 [Acinetobacter larvae]
MNDVENEILAQQQDQLDANKEKTSDYTAAINPDPIDVVELVLDAGKLVVESGKEIVTTIVEHIDFNF